MPIIQYSKLGDYNRLRDEVNQDCIFKAKTSRFEAYAVADGVSSCINGHIGAQVATQAACEYLLQAKEDIFAFDIKKTAYLVIEQVCHKLKEKAEAENMPINSYASTLIFCLIDRKLGTMMLFNLGDGAIFNISDDTCKLILTPISLGENACALTTTKGAYKTAQVKILSASHDSSILICTDGLYNLMKDKCAEQSIKQMITNKMHKQLRDYLDRALTPDVCSFVHIF